MIKMIRKHIKKPVIAFNEMPDIVCNRIYGTIGCIVLFLLSGIIITTVQLTLRYLFIVFLLSAISITTMIIWYYPFAYDKITILEGTVTSIEANDNEFIKFLEKRLFYQIKRVYYKLTLDNGQEVFILFTNKKIKIDRRIRVYVCNTSVFVRDNKYFIDNIHLHEFIN